MHYLTEKIVGMKVNDKGIQFMSTCYTIRGKRMLINNNIKLNAQLFEL